jgi:hypothetical protein
MNHVGAIAIVSAFNDVAAFLRWLSIGEGLMGGQFCPVA